MRPPSAPEQIQFLTNVQRLLSEGLFTATYKYALLAALADLSVELGDNSGAPLRLRTDAIAQKFIEYYWRQAVPYNTPSSASVLMQNTGKQSKVIALIAERRKHYGDSLPALMRRKGSWSALVGRVERIVTEMPLWKLQTVGKEKLDFLYGASMERGWIELRTGVAYCFRQFYSLLQDIVRSAWLRDIRTLNGELLGETVDLREFLFGMERSALNAARAVLTDLQKGSCFYCGRMVEANVAHIDHFIPWSKYNVDLGHNFVLTDSRCNAKKRDRMPHVHHLATWSDRNRHYGDDIASAVKDRIPCDLPSTNRIAHWAYSQTEASKGLTWLRGDELLSLSPDWRKYLEVTFP